LRGELDIATAAAAMDLLMDATAIEPLTIVDLAALEFIDCRGLGVLVRALKQARGAGHQMVLAAPSPSTRKILSATGLGGVLTAYPDTKTAAREAGQGARERVP
jgi:anti-anti-sigma factor